MDDRLLELLEQWEEARSNGKQLDLAILAQGDPELAAQLQRQTERLKKLAWLDCAKSPADELQLPSLQFLSSSLLTPENLTLKKFQAYLAAADLVPAAKLKELAKSPHAKTACQLAGLLLEQSLLTRFQLRSIAHGKTRGLKLGQYVILDKIGAGGMGQVYKARHSKMGRSVALKVLPRAAMTKSQGLERFQQEMKVAAQLQHDNIVTAFDADDAEGLHFFVMEYVEGRDLSSTVHKDGPLSVALAVDCMLQTAQGLEYAHGVGLVHRDIKPANLLLDQNGVLKILDMGIARIQTDPIQASLTQNGAVMGTADFMAPEQAVDAKTVTQQADLYSLGCTLYYLLTGRPPFAGETLMVKLLGHREQPAPPLTIRSDVPPQLEAIYQKCMAKSPADRYPNATQLIVDLQKIRPQLSEMPPSRSLSKQETVHDTSPTSSRETQPFFAAEDSPRLAIDSARKRVKQTSGGRGASFYGGTIGAALLFCGLLYFSSGLFFKFSTPPGTLILLTEEDQFVAYLRDQELMLINQKTEQRTPIKLLSPQQTALLPPGQYKFALDANNSLKTDIHVLTILSGGESKVQVSWKPAKTPPATAIASSSSKPPQLNYALELDGVDDYVELPFGYQGETPLTIEVVMPIPESPMPKSTFFGTTEAGGIGLDFAENPVTGIQSVHVALRSKTLGNYATIRTSELPARGTVTNVTAVFNSHEFRLYIDGKQCGQYALAEEDRIYSSLHFALGVSPAISPPKPVPFELPHKGKFQQLRISQSERYTADFTPQYQFTPDEQTFALYRFQEGAGAILKDSSGNNRHGLIYGNPSWIPLPPDNPKTVKTPSPASSTSASEEWKDLLSMIDLAQNVIAGKWSRNKTSIQSGTGWFDRLYVPYAVTGSYKVGIEFSRISGSDGLILRLPTTRGCFDFILAGYSSKLSGIRYVDQQNLRTMERPSLTDAVNEEWRIKNRKRYRLEVAVDITPSGVIDIRGVMDGESFAMWHGSESRLSGVLDDCLPEARMLGVCSYGSSYEIHRLEIQLPVGALGQQLDNADWGRPFYQVANEPTPELAKLCKGWNGRYYLFGENSMPLPYAQGIAQLHKARLVTVSSTEEEAFLIANMPNKTFWTAAWRHSNDLTWRDDRNRPLNYIGKWAPGQPDTKDAQQLFATISAPSGFAKDPNFTGWIQRAADSSSIYPVYEWGEE